MPEFRTTRRTRHSAQDMFALVADVEKYPEFVPLCTALRVRERRPADDGMDVLTADMTVAYKLIRETFTSRVTLDRPRLEIRVAYLDGPFERLDNCWSYVARGDQACDVVFFISYEFRSRMLGRLMGAVFETAFRRFSAAFETRADQVFGRVPSA
jgi:coenzyme Q-binding protein COQ10